MLDKLITNLKNSLSKKEVSDDSESSEKTVVNFTSVNPNIKKNKNSMVIKVIVVLGLAYLAVDQFLLKEEVAPVVEVIPKKKKPKLPLKDPAIVASDPSTAVAEGSSTDTKVPTEPVEKIPPVENINIAANPTEPTKVEEVKNEEVKVETEIAKVEEVRKEEAPATESTPQVKTALGEKKTPEKDIDKQIDLLIEKDNSGGSTAVKPITLKDKIEVEDSYIEPPTYEDSGRGLVYNCKDKFWVCVDKPSYIICNKNMKYNKSHDKKPECSVVNVYNSTEDCGLIQKFYVSTAKSTEFCN